MATNAATGHGMVYVPEIADIASDEALPLANARFTMPDSYIDVVIEDGLEYGTECAREIIQTTRDWSPYWLNDRMPALSIGVQPSVCAG